MNKELIVADHITFAYPGNPPVLINISLAVRAGEFLVITGPNGAAKTTLLKLMLGLLQPQEGAIHVKELAPGLKPVIGYVPQKSWTFNPGFPATVEEVVALHLRYPQKARQKLVDPVLEKLGLIEKRDCLLGTLSGGQLQRVYIARALINAPQILFLDEPAASLDTQAQEDFRRLIASLNQEGITIVMVSHDPEAFRENASRFVKLSLGALVEVAKESMKAV